MNGATFAATPPSPAQRWCRVAGLRQLGSAQGSGLREVRYVVQRSDGQVMQLSELLFLVVREVSVDRDPARVASAVSAAYGRVLTPTGLQHLISTKLEPLGLVEDATRTAPDRPAPPQLDPLLSLRGRRTLLPARSVIALARLTQMLFFPPLVALALGAVVLLELAVFGRGSVTGALGTVLATPTFLLALLAILIAGSLVHEVGHAAACHYGGADPGVIGVGLYIVFPAFFTNVTDSYRLDRVGRIRTDLGGLYFNVWCLIILDIGYLLSGNGLLLLASLLMLLEMLEQLIPTVRFDGYFVLADLAGVPDLFARVGPVMLSLMPGRQPSQRVTELRPAARRIVTCWVLVVVPLLVVGFGLLLIATPTFVRHVIDGVHAQVNAAGSALSDNDIPAFILAIVSAALLILPLLGLALLAERSVLQAMRGAAKYVRTRSAHRSAQPDPQPLAAEATAEGAAMVDTERTDAQPSGNRPALSRAGDSTDSVPDTNVPARVRESLTATAFTDERLMRTPGGPVPNGGWRRAVYAVSLRRLNPGPSAEERRRAETLARVLAPIHGSRRVVVMSRKGGVGKTTTTLALGGMFATLRGDRVIAVDANPDAGNLAHRVAQPSHRTITDLLGHIDDIDSYAELRAFTTQSPETRLEVLASDDDPRIGLALNRHAYHRVIDLLGRYYNLILLDTGTGILDSANQGLLREADQLVLVLRPAVDGARAAALTLDWLSEHGYPELVASAVVVVNATRHRSQVSVDKIADHFARRCSTVITVPWDPALEAGARTTLDSLRRETRQALVGLAAAVADQFADSGTADIAETGAADIAAPESDMADLHVTA